MCGNLQFLKRLRYKSHTSTKQKHYQAFDSTQEFTSKE